MDPVEITGRRHGARVGHDPMLYEFPLLPFVPVGAATLVRRSGKARIVWIATLSASVISSLFYFSFIAGGPGDLEFGNLRYWALWYPLWAILAVIGIAVLARTFGLRRASSALYADCAEVDAKRRSLCL
jgi:hypothetical protein